MAICSDLFGLLIARALVDFWRTWESWRKEKPVVAHTAPAETNRYHSLIAAQSPGGHQYNLISKELSMPSTSPTSASRHSSAASALPALSVVPDAITADVWASGVVRIQRMLAPAGFALDRWTQIAADCAALFEHHGGDLRRLGWSTVNLFGAHRDAPAVAVRCYGLALLLDGGEVVDLAEDHAKVRRPSGALLTFTRTTNPGAVPIWNVQE